MWAGRGGGEMGGWRGLGVWGDGGGGGWILIVVEFIISKRLAAPSRVSGYTLFVFKRSTARRRIASVNLSSISSGRPLVVEMRAHR